MIRSVSTNRAKQLRRYAKQRRKYLLENPLCEAHGKIFPTQPAKPATEIHHAAGRTGSLLLDESKWIGVCSGCHEWIGYNIRMARAMKLIAKKGEWNSTAKTKQARREVE